MMDGLENTGETMMLDEMPLSLITRAGVERWIEAGVKHRYRYDQVCDPLSGKLKFRCLYEKDGEVTPYVLVGEPDSPEGARVILFDDRPDLNK